MTEYRGDGLRAARITKKREIEIEDAEIRKKKLADSLKVSAIENNFVAHYDAVEQEIRTAQYAGKLCMFPGNSLCVGGAGHHGPDETDTGEGDHGEGKVFGQEGKRKEERRAR